MSRKMPPEWRTYSIGGGAGSRLVIRTRCGSPTGRRRPPRATDACAGSKRRLKPIWNGTPASSTAASARSTVSRSSETGFSQKIALPARAASTIRSACVSVSCRSPPRRRRARRAPRRSIRRPARRARRRRPRGARRRGVVDAPSPRAPGTRRASRSACMRPMRPTPMTAMRRRGRVAVAASRHPQSSRSETTGSQRPLSTDFSSAAWTPTHSSASAKPGECGRPSATERQNS